MIFTILFFLALPAAIACTVGMFIVALGGTEDFAFGVLYLARILCVGYFIGFLLLALFGVFDPSWPQLRLSWT